MSDRPVTARTPFGYGNMGRTIATWLGIAVVAGGAAVGAAELWLSSRYATLGQYENVTSDARAHDLWAREEMGEIRSDVKVIRAILEERNK